MSIFAPLTVLELSTVLAGPAVGMFFAEFGANVIKVEPIEGDVTRQWLGANETNAGNSAYFSAVNWGKTSIAINLKTEEGQAMIHHLIPQVDIVITNFKPGSDKALHMDYTTLSALNPRLIYAQITGYGTDSNRLGYDAVLQAESGFMFLNREPGQLPLKMPVALIDVLAAHHLKEAILIALYQRTFSHVGDYVHCSLIEVALSSLANQAAAYLYKGLAPQPLGSAHPTIAPYGQVFETADHQYLLLGIGNDDQFRAFCQLLELNSLPTDTRFATNAERVKNREALQSLLAESIQQWRRVDLLTACKEHQIPAGAIFSVEEAFEQYGNDSLWLKNEFQTVAGVRTMVGHFGHKNAEISLSPPPQLGQDTRILLSEIWDYERQYIEQLITAGIVYCAPEIKV